ncbi:hypothetical protein FEM03_10615 [Phragmitibacter flavus]|uniref:Uncharacterized protein n=1 Tax=Phragmitibacter flavus TaxID=2576071 RepID=A0A5R8KEN9_9BACT|nr:hypothetical protein [Phragmitibacter flavus]TLD70754.1 hypothetical protein FEM03_10615 [Phragmitibacter flavus]
MKLSSFLIITALAFGLVLESLGAQAVLKEIPEPASVSGGEIGGKPPEVGEIGNHTLPADFLDRVSLEAKARWRSLYREAAAAAPPTERLKVAFTLGGLLADSHLAFQAGDAQQFKNINQDVLRYCSALGLADKVTPLVMSESKMAEGQEWVAVRPMLHEKRTLVEKLLGEQRDEDQATLVNLGMWFRLFEISTDAVISDVEAKDRMVCIGSMELLDSLALRYETLSEKAREDESVAVIGKIFGQLLRKWPLVVDGKPTDELVGFTAEKVKSVNEKLTLK